MAGGKHIRTAIVGGGPAGSVAALCLRRLGHEVIVFEKESFPRYQIGESLLPGTMSILHRLGIAADIHKAGFPVKRAATFVWGADQAPWTFSLSTPKPKPWTYDHAYQVNRDEFDKILLDNAENAGALIRRRHEVRDIDWVGDQVRIDWKNCNRSGSLMADFVVDASGGRGLVAKKLNLRRFDDYFRNMAVWSYFQGGKRFTGELMGNNFSIAFPDGWIWIIPLKGDRYSVGIVTDKGNSSRIKEMGVDPYFTACLQQSPVAMEILENAQQCARTRVIRDWAYDATTLARNRAFLCGDSACFIDPLFAQGVHLAVYSATLAASAIDRASHHPGELEELTCWFDGAYRNAYNNYHRFLTAFYSFNARLGSGFWKSRQLDSRNRKHLESKDWYRVLTGGDPVQETRAVEKLRSQTHTLESLWRHNQNELTESTGEEELSIRRIAYANSLIKCYRSMTRMEWSSGEVHLIPGYEMEVESFRLTNSRFLGNQDGTHLPGHPVTENHRGLFAGLQSRQLGYKGLISELRKIKGGKGAPYQLVGKLIENGFLRGYDKNNDLVRFEPPLRLGGVGADDDIS